VDATFRLGVAEVERRIGGGGVLRLSHQPVRVAEVAALGPALAAHPLVRTLVVSHTSVDDAAVRALVPLLQVPRSHLEAIRTNRDSAGDELRGCFAASAQSPAHECSSPYRGLHARRESVGVVHDLSRAIFCRPVPKP
jgi:hypothetical protein